MKAVATITWNDVLDWLAEAGSICSGMFVEYREAEENRASLRYTGWGKLRLDHDSFRPMSG